MSIEISNPKNSNIEKASSFQRIFAILIDVWGCNFYQIFFLALLGEIWMNDEIMQFKKNIIWHLVQINHLKHLQKIKLLLLKIIAFSKINYLLQLYILLEHFIMHIFILQNGKLQLARE